MPRAPAIGSAQDASFRSSASSDPCVRLSKHGDVGATRGKRAFILERWWQVCGRHARPNTPTVVSRHDVKLTIDRVAEDYAVVRVPKRHRVEKCFRIFVPELHGPGFSRVCRFVNPRGWTIADRKNESGLRIDCINVSKIKRIIRHRELLPRCATISCPQHRRPRPTCPRHTLAHRTHTTQPHRDPARLHGPTRYRNDRQHE